MSDTDPEADDTTAESHQTDAEKAEQAEQHGRHERGRTNRNPRSASCSRADFCDAAAPFSARWP